MFRALDECELFDMATQIGIEKSIQKAIRMQRDIQNDSQIAIEW
jgi:hypothetical protein